ncbi:MAG: YhgE/Pip domain-containing protein [Candidatus Pacebacteria bacterium]|nr:YhgE/Pip domain-containing protein [Candidatus Paceibacterota bacterium]
MIKDILYIISLEVKDLFRNKIKLLAVLVTVFVPLIYGILYLWAFWNPYENLQNIPISVVNEDRGGISSGNSLNLGNELVEELKNDKSLSWQFVDKEKARDSLDDGKTYASIFIPDTFTQDILSINSENPQKPKIQFQSRESNNYIATRITSAATSEIVRKLNMKITERYLKEAAVEVGKISTQMNDALTGVIALIDGVDKLGNGTSELSKGLIEAQNGSESLNGGFKKLLDGADKLDNGLDTLDKGVNDLDSALAKASDGADSLNQGIGAIGDGAIRLSNGLSLATTGAQKIADGNSTIYTNLKTVKEKESKLLNYVDKAVSRIDELNARIVEVNKKLPEGKKLPLLSSDLASAKDKIDQFYLAEGQLSSGTNDLATNMQKLKTGGGDLVEGVGKAGIGSSTLSSGLTDIREGSSKLAIGSGSLKEGSATLKEGLSSGSEGSKSLESGIGKLSEGEKAVIEGLGKEKGGLVELQGGLDAGIRKIKEETSPEKTNTIIASSVEPVFLEDISYNRVENYGTGLSPYFINLSLWVGALIVSILIIPKKNKYVFSNFSRLSVILGMLFLPALVGIIQSVVLGTVLINFLHLKINYLYQFFLFNACLSVCFAIIIQFFVGAFNKVGQLLCIIVLMLQLTSSAGTFPLETQPYFFQLLHPLMPMSYSMSGLREIISGDNMNIICHNWIAIAAFTCLFILGRCIIMRRWIMIKDIKPLDI